MNTSDHSPTFDELFAHAEWVRRLARHLVADEQRAEEVVQETWVAALESPPGKASNLRAWLAAVARNVARAAGRADGRRARRERGAARPEAQPSTAEIAERATLQRDLVDRVLALDEPYREILLLRYFEDLSTQAIAERLGLPAATVRTRHGRALAKLREKLGREQGDRKAWVAALTGLARMAPTVPSGTAMLAALSWKGAVAAALVLAGIALWTLESRRDFEPPATGAEKEIAVAPTRGEDDDRLPSSSFPERSALAPVADEKATLGTPEPTASALGRIVDLEGRPLVEVPIKRLAGGRKHYNLEGFEQRARERGAAWREREVAALDALPATLSGRDGSFVYDPRGDVQDLRVWQAGWTTIGGGWRLPPDGAEELLLIAAPTAEISGRVVDADRQPVAKASIRARLGVSMLERFPWTLQRLFQQELAGGIESDAQGGFAIAGAPRAASLELSAIAAIGGSFPVRPFAAAATGPVEIVIPRGSSPFELVVKGQVVDARGAPAEGAHVRMGHRETRSASDGSFRLALDRGQDEEMVLRSWSGAITYDLIAVRPGFQPAVIEGFDVTDRVARENAVLQLGPAALAISGSVVDARGAPQSGFEVALLDPLFVGMGALTAEDLVRDADGAGSAAVVTDAGGRFTITGLAARSYRLAALSAEVGVLIESEPIRAGVSDVVLRMADDVLHEGVRGRVVSRAGAPVAGVEVTVLLGFRKDWGSVLWRWGEKATTDAQGRFALPRAPARDAALVVAGTNVERTFFDVAGIVAGREVEITVPVLARFRVELRSGDPATWFAVVDRAGEFLALEVLEPGLSPAVPRRPRLRGGASSPCLVSDTAAMLVLYQEEVELRRVPIEVSGDEMRVIVP